MVNNSHGREDLAPNPQKSHCHATKIRLGNIGPLHSQNWRVDDFGFTIYICIPTKPKLIDIIVLIIGN